MAGTVMPNPVFFAVDANGIPYSGGKLYTYISGTSTPLPTYADANLASANENPVTLDSAGRAVVYLSASTYQMILKDSLGNIIWTRDPVTAVQGFNSSSDVVSITAANTRGLQISRAGGNAGLLVSSTGGSGVPYALASNTTGTLRLQNDSTGTPYLEFLGNNVTVGLTGTFTVSGGLLSVTGAGDHVFSANAAGLNRLAVRNTNSGAAAAASVLVGNDASLTAGALFALSSGWTTSGSYVADGVSLEATRAGGLSINASHASGMIRFYAGGSTTPALTISAAGGVTVGSFTSATATPGVGANHNFDLGNASAIIYQSGIAAANITGFAGGSAGRQLWVLCSPVAVGSLTLNHENAASTAANRITSATGADIVVSSTKAVQLIYDGASSRWLAYDVK